MRKAFTMLFSLLVLLLLFAVFSAGAAVTATTDVGAMEKKGLVSFVTVACGWVLGSSWPSLWAKLGF